MGDGTCGPISVTESKKLEIFTSGKEETFVGASFEVLKNMNDKLAMCVSGLLNVFIELLSSISNIMVCESYVQESTHKAFVLLWIGKQIASFDYQFDPFKKGYKDRLCFCEAASILKDVKNIFSFQWIWLL